jgi:hypothetical protein
VQLILGGHPYQKRKHTVGTEVIGLDLGPSTITIVSQQSEAQLLPVSLHLEQIRIGTEEV